MCSWMEGLPVARKFCDRMLRGSSQPPNKAYSVAQTMSQTYPRKAVDSPMWQLLIYSAEVRDPHMRSVHVAQNLQCYAPLAGSCTRSYGRTTCDSILGHHYLLHRCQKPKCQRPSGSLGASIEDRIIKVSESSPAKLLLSRRKLLRRTASSKTLHESSMCGIELGK